ncbi:MAG TPA: alginate export family protein [Nitrospiraceae bacterium]
MAAFMWILAVAIFVALPLAPALADPPVQTPVDHPGNIPPIPRGMPDLLNYHNFDPPKSSLFDIKNFTVSGDMRVRPEMRSQTDFGTAAPGTPKNDFYVQQWMRLGLNYAVSPDVDVLFQPQYAKNWGAANNTGVAGAGCNGGICANDVFQSGQGDSLFVRQAFIMIRNLGVQGLSLKAGRQLMVMGNHRLFGHFDWANTGFSHDGVTVQYSQPSWEFWGGWLRPMETDFNMAAAPTGANSSSFGVVPPGVNQANNGGWGDSDIFFARLALKPAAGLAIEPLWVFQNNNARTAGSSITAAHANGQNRHTVGARVGYRAGIFDGTLEAYHQFGAMSSNHSVTGGGNKDLSISAQALAAEGGVTLKDAPWSPRFGLEFNYASGDGDANCGALAGGAVASAAACNGSANTFENIYPTNHIVMGYADVMAWRNMVAYSGSLQVLPFDNKANHLELRYWNFNRASTGDNWYRAAQNVYFGANTATGAITNRAAHLAQEIDVIYTLFFKGNKVAWQTGYSYLLAGSFLDRVAQTTYGAGASAVDQQWAYTQLHVNF